MKRGQGLGGSKQNWLRKSSLSFHPLIATSLPVHCGVSAVVLVEGGDVERRRSV